MYNIPNHWHHFMVCQNHSIPDTLKNQSNKHLLQNWYEIKFKLSQKYELLSLPLTETRDSLSSLTDKKTWVPTYTTQHSITVDWESFDHWYMSLQNVCQQFRATLPLYLRTPLLTRQHMPCVPRHANMPWMDMNGWRRVDRALKLYKKYKIFPRWRASDPVSGVLSRFQKNGNREN